MFIESVLIAILRPEKVQKYFQVSKFHVHTFYNICCFLVNICDISLILAKIHYILSKRRFLHRRAPEILFEAGKIFLRN